MAKSRTPTGRFDLRIVVLRRVQGTPLANNETPETWPDPDVEDDAAAVAAATAAGAGPKAYYAARDRIGGNEIVAQAIRQSSGSMRLRIKGRAIPIEAVDRIRVVATGKVYQVTSEPLRESAETVIDVEIVIPRETVTA